jgi:hypothetical protein
MVKQVMELIKKAKESFPCKDCLTYIMCKNRNNDIIYDKQESNNHDILIWSEVLTSNLLRQCDLINKWYENIVFNGNPNCKFNNEVKIRSDTMCLYILEYYFQIKPKQHKKTNKSLKNKIKTRVQGWLKTHI